MYFGSPSYYNPYASISFAVQYGYDRIIATEPRVSTSVGSFINNLRYLHLFLPRNQEEAFTDMGTAHEAFVSTKDDLKCGRTSIAGAITGVAVSVELISRL